MDTMTMNGDDVRHELQDLEKAQGVHAATQLGAQATQAATQAAGMATMAAAQAGTAAAVAAGGGPRAGDAGGRVELRPPHATGHRAHEAVAAPRG